MEPLYKAISTCASLNPDSDDEADPNGFWAGEEGDDDDGEEEEEEEENGFVGDDLGQNGNGDATSNGHTEINRNANGHGRVSPSILS